MAHLVIVTSKYIALAIGLVILCRLRVKPLLLWSAIATSLAILVIHLYALFPLEQFGYDYSLFWTAGRDVWAGLDPYAVGSFSHAIRFSTHRPLFPCSRFCDPAVADQSSHVWTAGNVLHA